MKQATKITVVDAPMGTGKTKFAIHTMSREAGSFLYITPYLSEIDRVQRECKKAGRIVVTPEGTKDGSTKSDDLLKLVLAGKNIAATHALFKRIDAETVEALKHNEYTLIMDEVIEVLTPIPVKPKAIEEMVRLKALKLVESKNNPKVKEVHPGDYTGLNGVDVDLQFSNVPNSDIQMWAGSGRLVWINNVALLWLFPANIFSAFKKVYCLTFLFDGSYVKSYYSLHDLKYEYKSLEVHKRGRGSSYKLIPYDPKLHANFGKHVKPLINIYEGKMNDVGKNGCALSHNWWRKFGSQDGKKIGRHLASFFRSNPGEAMFTCFKKDKGKLSSSKHGATWLPHNQRATNQYRSKVSLAYTVNRFVNTVNKAYFEAFNLPLDEDLYALSEVLQWLFRSRLRDGKSVSLYIPSSRMRGLLSQYLAGGSLEADIEVQTI